MAGKNASPPSESDAIREGAFGALQQALCRVSGEGALPC